MEEKQYVVFKLNEEEYGVDIKNVKEITEYKKTTKIPKSPSFVDGVINVRGDTIPIIDLKKKFNLLENDMKCEVKRIIIVNIEDKHVGFIVDDASQVMKICEKDIDNPPEILLDINERYISGIGKVGDKLIVILDLKEVLDHKEKTRISQL